MHPSPKGTLGIFAKFPELGRVKTRLASTLGVDAALSVYVTLLEHTLRLTREISNDGIAWTVFCDASHSLDDYSDRLGVPRSQLVHQSEGDLGTRLCEASLFLAKSKRPFTLIGTDCAELTSDDLRTAFRKLKTADLVLGPAVDGGYYSLGTRTHHPSLFQGVLWSTNVVLDQTLERASVLKLKVELLRTLSDIDEEKDLPEWLKKTL